ncbi:MAG: hypothetical protein LBE76_03845 [Nitrososphaerota archaeon]|nr:hypothetical protein [Nitrososphaerota archaeon]
MHTDWHHCTNGKYLCTILDDSSRRVIAAGEFDAEITKNAIIVLDKLVENAAVNGTLFWRF